MPNDRAGHRICVGDAVKLTRSMTVVGVRAVSVAAIDGEYVYVAARVPGHGEVEAERYGCEMEIVRA